MKTGIVDGTCFIPQVAQDNVIFVVAVLAAQCFHVPVLGDEFTIVENSGYDGGGNV